MMWSLESFLRRPVSRLGAGALLLGIFPLAACEAKITDGGLPLMVELTVEQTEGAVGEAFRFSWQAQGTLLDEIFITFGDGEEETVEALGASEVSGWRDHSYDEAGTFLVTVTAFEHQGSNAFDEVSVQVTSNENP